MPATLFAFLSQSALISIVLGGTILAASMYWLKRQVDHMLSEEKEHSRSPFSEKLLRPAGESLRLKIDEIRAEIVNHVLTLGLLLMVAGIWPLIIFFLPAVWLIVTTSVVSGSCLLLAQKRWKVIRPLRTKLQNYRLGFDGERYVATELEPLIAKGYRVFHDFVFDRNPGGDKTTFNIDHIAVGPEGVFAIETKARRKPREAGPDGQAPHKVIFRNGKLRFPSGYETDAPLTQAQRNAATLSKWLTGSRNAPVIVTPVVTLPGWYIDRQSQTDFPLLSSKNLAKSLARMNQGPALQPSEIQQISDRIEDQCRDIEGE